MPSARKHYFDNWEFPPIEEKLDNVPHRVALAIIDTVRDQYDEIFDAFLAGGEWYYAQPWAGQHGTELQWTTKSIEAAPWGDGGFPVDIKVRPEDIAAAFKACLPDHVGRDGTISAPTRAELLASLADWRRAIDEAEAALNEHP